MYGTQVKRMSIGVVTVAGAFALAACGSSPSANGAASQAPSPAPVSSQAVSAASDTTPQTAKTAKQTATTPRCTSADLSASLGKPKTTDDKGQFEVPLTFKNTSSHSCGLHGVPGVDLLGPSDPNGTVYHLPRTDNGVKVNEVPSGTTATATITVLTPTDGSVGSNGSKSWTPTKLETIPPGQTKPLTIAWPANLPVERQDTASHPGSYVNGILADPGQR